MCKPDQQQRFAIREREGFSLARFCGQKEFSHEGLDVGSGGAPRGSLGRSCLFGNVGGTDHSEDGRSVRLGDRHGERRRGGGGVRGSLHGPHAHDDESGSRRDG